MKTYQLVLVVCIAFLVYSALSYFCKKKKPFKRAFVSMIIGACSLVILNISGIFTGVYLPLSPLSIGVSACLGIPGISAMIIMEYLI